jgi:hypothetical protein
MAIEFLERCDAIEECYEFMLAYAGQGLPSDQGSPSGSQIRGYLQRAEVALTGIARSCAVAVNEQGLGPSEPYQSFAKVLERDAQDSLAAIGVVLAQPAIGSQLIDNLNASLHLRALLTDLFLIGEVLRTRNRTSVT